MHIQQRRLLAKRHDASKWYGHSKYKSAPVAGLELAGAEIPGWTAHRLRLLKSKNVTVARSIWLQDGNDAALIAVDVYECKSVRAAHDYLLELLGNMQSSAVTRHAIGRLRADVRFGLDDTIVVFSCANFVVLVRNAGREIVSVDHATASVATFLRKRLQLKRSK